MYFLKTQFQSSQKDGCDDRDFNLEQNNCDYDSFHNQAALLGSAVEQNCHKLLNNYNNPLLRP